jgi:hypothetical protein
MKNLNPLFKNSITVFVVALFFLQTRVFAQCPAIASGSQVISMNLTLTGGTQIFTASTITIKAFTTLTLDAIDCQFYQGATVFLEQQAKLIIKNGSTLRGYCSSPSSAYWQGIRVIGDPSMPATAVSQGYVEITGSTIRDAAIAVRAYDGGLVKATSSYFFNNNIGIQLDDQVHGYPFAIYECTFDDDRWYPTFKSIDLLDVSSINIEGCTFKAQYHNLGIGVNANRSSFNVTASGGINTQVCPNLPMTGGRKSTFLHLNNGISISNTGGSSAINCNITVTDFIENINGIGCTGNSNVKIEHNLFSTTYRVNDFGRFDARFISDIYIYDLTGTHEIKTNDFFYDETNYIDADGFDHISYERVNNNQLNVGKNNFYCVYYQYNYPNPIHVNNNWYNDPDPMYVTIYANFYCNQFTGYPLAMKIQDAEQKNYNIGNAYNPANNVFNSTSSSIIQVFSGNYTNIYYALEYPNPNSLTIPTLSVFGGTANLYNGEYGFSRNCARCAPDETYCPDCKTISGEGNTSKHRNLEDDNNFLLSKDLSNLNTYKLLSRTSVGEKHIELFDLSGRLVYSGELTVGQNISFSGINLGLYIYKVYEGNKVVKVGKVAVE